MTLGSALILASKWIQTGITIEDTVHKLSLKVKDLMTRLNKAWEAFNTPITIEATPPTDKETT